MNDEQKKLWNGIGGRTWVEMQEVVDRVYAPVEELLVNRVLPGAGSGVLDVGCGTGGTTLAIARRLGREGGATGVDVSEPMIAAARARGAREGSAAAFVCADAETHGFEPASLDLVVSRFGVMFFDDPVRAFANLRRAARDGAELLFVAWRGVGENGFMTTAERAAAPLLPDLPARPSDPNAPGQFAFADPRRVERILEESGWGRIEIRRGDFECAFPESELLRWITRLGPLGRFLHGTDEASRSRVVESVRPAFDRYVHGGEVRFRAACWVVGARAS